MFGFACVRIVSTVRTLTSGSPALITRRSDLGPKVCSLPRVFNSAAGVRFASTATRPSETKEGESTGRVAAEVVPVEVLLSFDTTGSMYPCLTQVRRNMSELIKNLYLRVPGIRVGIIAHGDYCDAESAYVTKAVDFSVDPKALVAFVNGVSATGGGDYPECYELVLRKAHTEFSWSKVAQKALVMIGDAPPHSVNENPGRIDWKQEVKTLASQNFRIYSVQAMNYEEATPFYAHMALQTNGVHLRLEQFSHIEDFIYAICYREHSPEQLAKFEAEVRSAGRMNRSLNTMFDKLAGRTSTVTDASRVDELVPVPSYRFQVLRVDEKMPIKKFAEQQGLSFQAGRGFYEFTKPETVKSNKEVVLQDKVTGDFFTGDEAKTLIGVGTTDTKLKPSSLEKWRVFVQSTSYNRVLVPGTGFLYEVDEF